MRAELEYGEDVCIKKVDIQVPYMVAQGTATAWAVADPYTAGGLASRRFLRRLFIWVHESTMTVLNTCGIAILRARDATRHSVVVASRLEAAVCRKMHSKTSYGSGDMGEGEECVSVDDYRTAFFSRKKQRRIPKK
jgi:hypothetical protein